MSAARKELQEAMCCYTIDTLIYISTVREFCEQVHKWTLGRETELDKMKDIKERADASKFTLAAWLKDTLGGLEKLHCFLDAVENLAVTSLHVFTCENSMLHLPEGIRPQDVEDVIKDARKTCPLLIEFRRDATAFFLPKLQNVEVLSYQLDKYIKSTQTICGTLEKSSLSDFCIEMNDETLVDLNVDLSEDDIQRMLRHIKKLKEIRMNQSFRTVFLFQGECSNFTSEFQERRPRMLQFLKDLEGNAVQLDRMNKGAKISSVVGSSVGAAGGVLSIIGLALIPVTAGVSLALTMTGLGMGITSGVNGLVTTATEIGVNHKHQNQAMEIFQGFMEDVKVLQDCLEEASKRVVNPEDIILGVGEVFRRVGAIGKGIKGLVDEFAALKMLKSGDLVVDAGKVAIQEGTALRNGRVAVKGSLALSKSARAFNIGLNALFLGLDIFFICKDSIGLAKGSETDFSQFIRARAALWRSELDSWQKIYDSLSEGLPTAEGNKVILETPFYPSKEKKKNR
ncbi:uncharacterized protein ACO6RY_02080 [Pungitius sinensis]